MDVFDKLGLDVTTFLLPWIAILISISVAFWFKDFATNMMQGIKFKMNPAFNEGDSIILNDEDAIIVKIGLRETVFGVYSKKGYTWRFIQNDKIHTLKLEKIINKNLHLDTDAEKGRRIQEMIDKAQNNAIEANKSIIEKNKSEIETLKNKN
jgi:small-conductance mechanosensitive channel|tara:strand:+ start:357 stop:812 length:456 start_codon:yes stop_codon:yes gene_type:complete